MPVRAKVVLDDANLVTLPKSQWNRVQKLRAAMLDNLADAVADLGLDLEDDTRRAIAAIKAGRYKESVVKRETNKLMAAHYGRLGRAIAGQVKHAASLAGRYSEIVSTFARDHRKATPLPAHATEWLIRAGDAPARMAIAPEALLTQQGTTPTRFAADRILKENVKPWRQARVLSRDLHGRALKAADEITSQTMAAVREAKQLTEASTSLIRAVRKTSGGELGGNAELSRLMKRVEKAGRDLNTRGGPEALKEWQAVRKQMRSNMRRLAEGGRTKSSLMELLQNTSKDSAKGIDRAIRQHSAFKQKYAAERIIKTETMASYKAEQVLSDQKHDFIIGYYWRMNRAARAGFVKRRTSKSGRIIGAKKYRRGGRRRRCVCEELDGKRLSKEAVSGRSARLMAHPHCMCYLEPVMDKRRLNVAQASDFD